MSKNLSNSPLAQHSPEISVKIWDEIEHIMAKDQHLAQAQRKQVGKSSEG